MKILLVGFSILIGTQAFGWSDLGHQTVAEIAEKNLNEKAKDFVIDILGEPMAVSAIWPDKVRSDERFKGFAPYHFFEIPEGYKYETIPQDLHAPRSADTILKLAPKYLLDEKVSRAQKNLFLKMLIHVAGDVHQPLHVGNGEDMGANLCDVKWENPYRAGKYTERNLHVIWDEDIFEYALKKFKTENATLAKGKYFFDYKPYSAQLIKKFEGQDFSKEVKQPLEVWYQQSRDLHAEVYPDAKPTLPADRTYCVTKDLKTGKITRTKYDPATLPKLGADYAKKALEIAEKQIYLGGLRLANLLNEMTVKTNPPDADPTGLKATIEAVQIKD